MSTDGISYEFFNLPMAKDLLKIKQTDDADNQLLRGTIGLRAERWVKNKLIPFADSFPLSQEEQEAGISAACNMAASLYKKRINNENGAKDFKEAAEEDINSLIAALQAKPTTRTTISVASMSYDTEDDILFSQRLI